MPTTSQPGDRAPAQGGVADVQAFLNTNDIEGGHDDFADEQSLRKWLVGRGLLRKGGRLTPADVDRVISFREGLRAFLADRQRPADLAEAIAVLNSASDTAPLHVVFARGKATTMRSSADDVTGSLGRLLALIYAASMDGSLSRLKICENDACRWAYFDYSRNRAGRWCTMKVCGGRQKARAFRNRHNAAA